ncbi:MAG TPA: hypothetical protein VH988_18550 [Thermoanaerobaculia bacterium]|jgi:hypothetical protein|nr:hypothetical protein [Thermoanaerobaculia bacterium]
MSLVIRSPLTLVGLVAGSLAAVVAAVMSSKGSLLVVAVLLLLPVATSLSQAGRLAASLQGLKRRAINVVVWGVPIRGPKGAELRVESVGAVGAGLLIYLMDAEEAKTLLKVAQPRSWLVEEGRVVIGKAAYVQWAGKRLAQVEGVPAVAIISVTSGVA